MGKADFQEMLHIKCHILPGSMSNHARIFSLMASSDPPFIMSDVTLLEGEEKIDTWPWRNLQTPGSCHNFIEATSRGAVVLSTKASISIKTLRRGLFSLFARPFSCPHKHIKTDFRHACRPQTSSHTGRLRRPSILATHLYPHTNTPPPNTHAQSVWSVNLVPRGARRVTPLTGQTRLDSQQTDKY